MAVLKSDLKILKYISHHKTVSRSQLCSKFPSERLDVLTGKKYICHDYEFPQDRDGFPIGDISGSAMYFLTDAGRAEVEQHQWFDTRFVLLQIVLPIVIAIITTLITVFLTTLLSPSL